MSVSYTMNSYSSFQSIADKTYVMIVKSDDF